MNSLKCPPDYSKFSIGGLELEYEALSAMLAAATNVVNQPKANGSGRRCSGADHIENAHIAPLDEQLDRLIAYLRARVPTDGDDEDRQARLVMLYELQFGGATARSIAARVRPKPNSRGRATTRIAA